MKFTKIALACGLALSALSAQAAGPTIPPGTVTIYLSGASAPDNFLADIANSLLTNVVSARNFTTNSAGVETTQHRAFLGTATGSIAGVPSGTSILLIKRSAGGSVFGVDPVARASRIQTIDLNNCVAGTNGFAFNCGTRGIDPGVAGHNTASNAGLVPDFGISDVEPALFQFPYNTENNQPQLTRSELGRLAVSPVNQIAMGIVATNAVSANTSISRSQYGGMLAGLIQDWSSIDGSDSPVVVCRRVNGSGTQSSYNWFFTGFPCNAATNGFAATIPAVVNDSFGVIGGAGTTANPIVIDPSAGFTVIENSSSGDVRACLNAAQNGTEFNVTGSNNLRYRVLFNNVGGPSKAIGVLSLDSYNNANTDGRYSFRHLDGAGTFNAATQTSSAGATGIAPSKANILGGAYDFVVELTAQARNATVTNVNGDVVPALTLANDPVKFRFYQEFVRRAGSTRYTGNDGGTFSSTTNAFATLPQTANYVTSPAFVSRFSRGGNTCAPLIAFPPLN